MGRSRVRHQTLVFSCLICRLQWIHLFIKSLHITGLPYVMCSIFLINFHSKLFSPMKNSITIENITWFMGKGNQFFNRADLFYKNFYFSEISLILPVDPLKTCHACNSLLLLVVLMFRVWVFLKNLGTVHLFKRYFFSQEPVALPYFRGDTSWKLRC